MDTSSTPQNPILISSETISDTPQKQKSDTEDDGFGSFEEAEMVDEQIQPENVPEVKSMEVDVDEFLRPKRPLSKVVM